MIGNLLASILSMGVAAIVSIFAHWFFRLRRSTSPIDIKIGGKSITLDLAQELPAEQANVIIQNALASYSRGDDEGLHRIEEQSRAASATARDKAFSRTG